MGYVAESREVWGTGAGNRHQRKRKGDTKTPLSHDRGARSLIVFCLVVKEVSQRREIEFTHRVRPCHKQIRELS